MKATSFSSSISANLGNSGEDDENFCVQRCQPFTCCMLQTEQQTNKHKHAVFLFVLVYVYRLCQVLNVDPLPVLIAEVVFSNIGGTATAVGDPPNVIIVSNKLINEKHVRHTHTLSLSNTCQTHTLIPPQGIGFGEFTLHLSLGIILCMGVAFALLACIYCTCVRLPNKDPPHIAELKREIAIWERTASRMPVVSLEETAVRGALREKAGEVKNQLQREVLLRCVVEMFERVCVREGVLYS